MLQSLRGNPPLLLGLALFVDDDGKKTVACHPVSADEGVYTALAGNILEGRLIHTLEVVVSICTIISTIIAIVGFVRSSKRKK